MEWARGRQAPGKNGRLEVAGSRYGSRSAVRTSARLRTGAASAADERDAKGLRGISAAVSENAFCPSFPLLSFLYAALAQFSGNPEESVSVTHLPFAGAVASRLYRSD